MKFDALILDSDGVLIDSVSKKIDAFRQWVRSYMPEHEDEFISYHIGVYGIGRAEQLKYFFDCIARIEVDEELFSREMARLGEIINRCMANPVWRKDSNEFVKYCFNKGVPLYIVSGSPQSDLVSTYTKLGAKDLFREMIGSPTSKKDGIKVLLDKYRHNPGRVLYIGDATADSLAAEQAGVVFIYFPSEAKMTSTYVWKTIKSLREVVEYV